MYAPENHIVFSAFPKNNANHHRFLPLDSFSHSRLPSSHGVVHGEEPSTPVDLQQLPVGRNGQERGIELLVFVIRPYLFLASSLNPPPGSSHFLSLAHILGQRVVRVMVTMPVDTQQQMK
jgi:hypothetical protein